jgi:hypothetical protein
MPVKSTRSVSEVVPPMRQWGNLSAAPTWKWRTRLRLALNWVRYSCVLPLLATALFLAQTSHTSAQALRGSVIATTGNLPLPQVVLSFDLPDGVPEPLQSTVRDIFKDLYEKHPELITDPLKQLVPEGTTQSGAQGENGIVVSVGMIARDFAGRRHIRVGLRSPSSFAGPKSTAAAEAAQQIARKLARAIEEKTIAVLPDFSRDYIKKQLTDRQSQLEKQLQDAENKLNQLRSEITRDTGLPSEKAAEQLAEVSRQQIAAELALVGMEARERAIAREMEKCRARMDESEAKDETVGTLQRLLKLRMDRLDREKQLHQTGVSPEQDVRTAEADVLTAKIDLDKTRAALKRAGGGEQLDAFTAELSRLAIDRAETQARRDWLEKLSKDTSQNLTERREVDHRLELAKRELPAAENSAVETKHQLDDTKKDLENIQPLHLLLPDDSSDDPKNQSK